MRTLALAAVAAAAALIASPLAPGASATPGGTLTLVCDITYTSNGTLYDVDGDCLVTGVLLNGAVFLAQPADFNGVAAVTGGLCGLTSSVAGRVAGWVNLDVTWARVGVLGAVNTRGDVDGAGYAEFSNGPCSPGLSETVAMEIVGT